MKKLLFLILTGPLMAFAHPSSSSINCNSADKSTNVTVTDSASGDGGLFLTINGFSDEIDQVGMDKHVAGDTKWEPVNKGVSTLYHTGNIRMYLDGVPAHIKNLFINGSKEDVSLSFDAQLSGEIFKRGDKGNDTYQVIGRTPVKCTFEFINGTGN